MTRVLIVDDSEAYRAALRVGLERLGYGVLEIGRGNDALFIARSQRPDVIVLDLDLPDVAGRVVCRWLKTDPETAAIPVVIVTAWGDEQDRIDCFAAGADGFALKPLTIHELHVRLCVVLPPRSGAADLNGVSVVGTSDSGPREIH